MFIVYTDGSCSPNPGSGGWAAILFAENGERQEIGGSCSETTNNRMEIIAVIESLKRIPKEMKVQIHSDSSYVIRGITEWLPNWLKSDFKRGKVLNIDLWKELSELCLDRVIEWIWVKSHNGNIHNEEVDRLANQRRLQV